MLPQACPPRHYRRDRRRRRSQHVAASYSRSSSQLHVFILAHLLCCTHHLLHKTALASDDVDNSPLSTSTPATNSTSSSMISSPPAALLSTSPTISPSSAPTLPPHRQHNKCPLKPKLTAEITHVPPLVIGHRGASYNVPEHTLAGYRLALELGADYIEPDLVPTKDGHLVAIHSVDLNITTNVDTVFPKRRRDSKHMAEGSKDSGYYVQDFTLAEIKQLKVKQRVEDTPARSRYFDGLFEVPTLEEIVALLHEWNTNARPYVGLDTQKIKGRAGLYAELKKPAFLQQDAGINVADLLIGEIKNNPTARDMFLSMHECANLKADEYQVPPLVLQCFDRETLAYLHEQFTTDDDLSNGSFPPPMVLLLSYKDCNNQDMWYAIQRMNVAAVGPDKRCLLETNVEGLGREFVNSAKEHELGIHAWTERLETEFVDTDRFATAHDELRYLFCDLEIEGMFAENVDVAVRVGKVGCVDDGDKEGGNGGGDGKGLSEGGDNKGKIGASANTGAGSNCQSTPNNKSDQQELATMAAGFTLFGGLLGAFFTYLVSIGCNRRRIKRGTTRRQVQVPTAEAFNENELI